MEKIKYYPRVGHSKARELYVKNEATLRVLTKERTKKEVRDVVQEGIVREFMEQFIPRGWEVGRGFVYDPDTKKHSPEIDAILYTGPPLMEFGDVVVTEKSQTKLMVEVKSWAKLADLFGKPLKDRKGKTRKKDDGTILRDPNTDFQTFYRERSSFGEKYVLFIFSLEVSKKIPDQMIWNSMNKLSDMWVVVWRKSGKKKLFDYGNSVSKFIEQLRTLNT
jgi:hypothetical protein